MQKLLKRFIDGHNGKSELYRLLYSCCLILHSLFVIIFFTLDIKSLAFFNVGSVSMYLVGFLFVNSTKRSSVWLFLMFSEIVAHAFLCNIKLGWSYGFSYYGLLIIPLVFYISYIDESVPHPMVFSTLLAFMDITVMLISYFIEKNNSSAVFPHELEHFMSCLNMLFSAVSLIIFSVLYVYSIRNTMAALNQKNAELDFLANYDALTMLRNRHHIAEQFHIYENGTKPYCVILGDIDDFKRINDTYSHDCGDKVLITVADIINKGIGDRGTVCRWGGEEILIIVFGTSDECLELVENIRLKIQNTKLSFNRREIHVTMTFGFSDYGEAMNIEKLVSVADSRLYKGKRNGKNQVVYHQYDR